MLGLGGDGGRTRWPCRINLVSWQDKQDSWNEWNSTEANGILKLANNCGILEHKKKIKDKMKKKTNKPKNNTNTVTISRTREKRKWWRSSHGKHTHQNITTELNRLMLSFSMTECVCVSACNNKIWSMNEMMIAEEAVKRRLRMENSDGMENEWINARQLRRTYLHYPLTRTFYCPCCFTCLPAVWQWIRWQDTVWWGRDTHGNAVCLCMFVGHVLTIIKTLQRPEPD